MIKLIKIIFCSLLIIIFTNGSAWMINAQGKFITALGWNNDGGKLAIGFSDGTVSILDSANSEAIYTGSFGEWIEELAWHPTNPNILAIASIDIGRSGRVDIIDISINPVSIIFTENLGISVTAIAWRSDGNRLAITVNIENPISDNYTELQIWNIADPTEPEINDIRFSLINDIDWFYDENNINHIAMATAEEGILLWDIQSGDIQTLYEIEEFLALDLVAFSPDGTQLAVGGLGEIETLQIRSLSTGSTTGLLEATNVSDMEWINDEIIAVISPPDNRISLIDVNSAQEVIGFSSNRFTFAWDGNANQFAFVDATNTVAFRVTPILNTLTLVNADTDTDIRTLSTATTETIDIGSNNISIRADTDLAMVGSVVFTVDGNVVATDNTAPYTIAGENDSDILPWNIAQGTYTLIATPYSDSNGTGTAGTPLTLMFTIRAE